MSDESAPQGRPRVAAALVVILVAFSGCTSVTMGEAQAELPLPAALLWSDPYTSLRIEVDHFPGREPSAPALQALLSTAKEVTQKSEVVLDNGRPLPWPGERERVWTLTSLDSLHRSTFDSDFDPDRTGRGEEAFLHIVYIDGQYEDPVVGLQVGMMLVIFIDQIRGTLDSQALGTERANEIERQVLIHEFGHALGLVNCGIPMLTPRETPGSRCHSTHEASVMHDSVDRLDAVVDLAEKRASPPPTFDDADLRDLRAYREQR